MGVEVLLKKTCLRRQIEDFLARLRSCGEVEIEAVGFVGIGREAAAGLIAGRAVGLNPNRVVLGLGGWEIEGEGDYGWGFGLRIGED